jgi:exodeoxyribonuclease VII small subunit
MGDLREPAASPNALSFEQALERLEALVERLERGDLALEDALAAFEEGVGLTRELGDQLASAERRIEQLLRDGA